MNERIEELAKQSGIGLFKDNSFGWSVLAGTDSHLQKFTQLIVAECVTWVNDNVGMVDEEARADLLKHFGVEE